MANLQEWFSDWSKRRSFESALTAPKKAHVWAPRGYESFPVEVEEGAAYHLVVDKGTPDPVVRGYREGYDENLAQRRLMAEFTEKGDTVLDLGAHVGTFALVAAAMGRTVIAVDASPKHVDLLNRSVKANRFRRMQVVQAAVGTTRGVVRFHMGGLWGMVAQDGVCAREVKDAPVVEVRAVVGDEMLKSLKCSRISFMKMDIEGSEVAAIRGMSDYLGRADAPVINFECNGVTLPIFGESRASLIQTLEGYGYRVFRPEEDEFAPVRPETFQPEPYLDLVAMKPVHEAKVADRIRPALSIREMAARIAGIAGQAHVVERSYIAAALRQAESNLLADPAVQASLDRLAGDPLEAVRDAARWWETRLAG